MSGDRREKIDENFLLYNYIPNVILLLGKQLLCSAELG